MANRSNILKPSGCFEIQKVIGISTIHGNCRSYQVQWAPTWISGAHLIGCEDLIEQFEDEQKGCAEIEQFEREEKVNAVIDVKHSENDNVLNDTTITVMQNDKQNDDSASQLEIESEKEVCIGVVIPDEDHCKDVQKIVDHEMVDNTDIPYIRDLQKRQLVADSENNLPAINTEEAANLFVYTPEKMIVNQDDVDLNTNCSSAKNNINHQSKIVFKDTSLDSIIQRISGRNSNPYACRTSVHPDFQEVKINTQHIKQEEVENQQFLNEKTAESKTFNISSKDSNSNVAQYSASFVNSKTITANRTLDNITKLSNASEPFKSNQRNDSLHRRDNKAMRTFQCRVCGKVLTDAVSLQTHKEFQCIFGYKCIVCYKTFELEEYLRKHEATVHSSCKICKEKFTNMEKLRVHIETHKVVKAGPLDCPYCGKKFSVKALSVEHLRVHTGERPFNCNICQKGFKRKQHLKAHLQMHAKVDTL